MIDPLTGFLGTHSGHGTFIAGLLHQACPEAQVTVVRIMGADGVVPEGDLDTSLTALRLYLDENPGTVDARVLSLGFYVETDDDAAYTPGLKELLEDLAAQGVTIFASAGNDGRGCRARSPPRRDAGTSGLPSGCLDRARVRAVARGASGRARSP